MTIWERQQVGRLAGLGLAWAALGAALLLGFDLILGAGRSEATSSWTLLPETIAAAGVLGAAQWAARLGTSGELRGHQAAGGARRRLAIPAVVVGGGFGLLSAGLEPAVDPSRRGAAPTGRCAALFEGRALACAAVEPGGRALDEVVGLEPTDDGADRAWRAARVEHGAEGWVAQGWTPLGVADAGTIARRPLDWTLRPEALAAAVLGAGPDRRVISARADLGWPTLGLRWRSIHRAAWPGLVALAISATAGTTLRTRAGTRDRDALGRALGLLLGMGAVDAGFGGAARWGLIAPHAALVALFGTLALWTLAVWLDAPGWAWLKAASWRRSATSVSVSERSRTRRRSRER